MIPEEFIKFSERFEVGFLVWIVDDKPTMELSDFLISREKILVEPKEYDPLRLPPIGSRVTLIFANPWYTERCEMGVVKGALVREGESLVIEPHDITWSLSFEVNRYPDKIVKRWRVLHDTS
jgi:hypothetical protein